MHLARVLLWLFLTALSMSTHAGVKGDLIVERSMFVEPAPGLLTIDEALTQDYKPFGSVLNRGFSPTVRWLRLLVAAPKQGSEQIVISVGPHYISDIQLFEKKEGNWSFRSAGDRFPASQNACVDNVYCFPVTIHSGVDNYFYLRIVTINGFLLKSRAMSPETLSAVIAEQQWLFGLESGVILAIGIWALLVFARTRHRVAGIFFLTEIVTLLFNFSSSGFLAELFFQNHVWLDNPTFNTLYVFRLMTSLIVTREFLRSYGEPKWYAYYVRGALAILFLELLALKFDYLTLAALNFNFLIITIMPLLFLLAISYCDKMPIKHKRLLGMGALLMGGLLWIDILPVLGWVRPDLVALPGNWGGLILAMVLSIMVNSDVAQRRVIYDREMQELQFLRARNLVESEQIKDRSMLIDMLTHELKNPLATMRMAAGSLRRSLGNLSSLQSADSTDRIDSMVQAINNMNVVIERCVQVDQLDQKGFLPKFEDYDVNEIVESIVFIKSWSDRVELRTQASPLIFRTDSNLFAIVVTNLLDNAIKYSEPQSPIILDIELIQGVGVHPAQLTMRVMNTIDEYGVLEPSSLFNRYYRGPYAHEKSGTGLGLYLVKSLCKTLGGSIRFEQNESQVSFIVELKR